MNTFKTFLFLTTTMMFYDARASAQTVITSSTDLTPGMITPSNGQSALNAGVVGGLATGAVQRAGDTMTGSLTMGTGTQINLPTYGLYVWNGPTGQHSYNGSPSAAADAIYFQPTVTGSSADGDLVHLWLNDNFQDTGGAGSIISVYDNIVGGAAGGNRTDIFGDTLVSATPGSAATYTALAGHSHASNPMPVAESYGWPWGLGVGQNSTSSGGVETGWLFNQHSAASTGLYANYDAELDMNYDAGSQVAENIGIAMVDQSSAPNTANASGLPGVYVNIGYDLQGGKAQGWGCAFCVGKETGDWALTVKGTILGAYRRMYGGAVSGTAINPAARYGIDWRQVAFASSNGAAIQTPGFSVSPTGAVGASSLTTSSVVQAQAATLTGATIETPGVYMAFPSFTVQPPPSGTTATVSVATGIVTAAVNFGATGKGYAANDVLTATLPGAAGTLPTFTVQGVDANGGITVLTQSAAAAVTSPPINGPISLSGGAGTGAMLLLQWHYDPGLSWNVKAWRFAATGAGWAVGDTATIVGDTGTAGAYTVGKVSPSGGIMMPLPVSSAGSVTALASGPYHAVTPSGGGTGGSIQVGYGVGSVTSTPGSGYVSGAVPLITSTQTDWKHADLTALMTNASAPLTLDPAGGKVVAGPDGLQAATFYTTAIWGMGQDTTGNPALSISVSGALSSLHSFSAYSLSATQGGANVVGGLTADTATVSGKLRAGGSVVSTETTTYPVVQADCGTTIRDTGTSYHTYTVPAFLAVGCRIEVIQTAAGSGLVHFAGASGEVLEQNGSSPANTTTTQWSKAQIFVDTSSSFLLSGQVQ